jgi:hypothetical protein
MTVTYKTHEYKAVEGEGLKTVETVHVDAFKGATLKVYRDTVRVMSDVWEDQIFALVWTGTEPQSLYINSWDDAKVDATTEVLEAYRKYNFDQAMIMLQGHVQRAAQVPASGTKVKVTKGRKDKNVQGLVVWVKEMPYGYGYRSNYLPKLCVSLDGKYTVEKSRYGKEFRKYVNVAWVWAHNVEVLDWEARMPSKADLEAEAAAAAARCVETLNTNWRAPRVHEFVRYPSV